MGQIRVQTPELAVAASVIGGTARSAEAAHAAAASARGDEAAFGGEPIGATFASMCENASQATAELAHTIDSLSRNVAAASLGYLTTDQGVVPIKALPGFKA